MTTNAPEAPRDSRLMLQQLARLVEVSVTLNSTLNPDELLQFIIKTAAEVLDCEAASIMLYEENKNRLIFAAATGSDPKKLAQIPVPLEGSIAGTIFREGRSLIQNNVSQDPRHFKGVAKQVNFSERSLLGVPMTIREKNVGVLEALNKRSGDFNDNDERLLSILASQAAVAINNARLVQALQKAYKDLSENDRLKNNFLSLASHELRTPLGIIIGYATFLQEEAKGEMSDHVDRVMNAASQMRSLIEAMTSLHMLQDQSFTLKPRVVPVQQVLHAAFDEVHQSAEDKKINVEFEFPPRSLLVTADPERLMPAFVNVLNNAIKFTDSGGEVIVGAGAEGSNILAWVKDTGIGIPEHEIEKIFQEFHQVEDHMTRQFGGLGIGLTIARGLIESQGGRIWAESEGPGKGATFKILLPPSGTNSLG